LKLTNKSYPIAKAVRSALLVGITASMLTLPSVYAAEAEEEAEEVTTEEVADETNTVTITGSRLQRQTYTSLSPLQVITAQASREVGLIDGAAILQGAAASTGQQIDLTFSGFVLDNGPGSSTANLRGLGSARTLTLLNGRRMAPSGVEGAPAAADLNLIPGALVQQYDLLLDGASSIYGSDAVAGVANVILRKDFDGFEVDLFTSVPEQSNGVETTLSLAWGKNYDRGFIGVGVEYTESEAVRLMDRKWSDECDKNIEVDTNGRINSVDIYYPSLGQRIDQRGCKPTQSLAGRIIVPFAGSVYYTPGSSNGGWGDWSESSAPFTGGGINSNGEGFNDVSFVDYTLNGSEARQVGHIYPKRERLSVMAYGEYTLEGDANLTPFFEASFNKRDVNIESGQGQFFPVIPANNPYNLCNPNGINGIDCGLANDALYENPAVWEQVFDAFGCTIFAGGTCDQTTGAIGPASVRIVAAVVGDRNNTVTTQEQTRIVGGLSGDIPFINFGDVTDWQFESYVSYTTSKGTSSRMGIRQDRIDQSLDVVETSPGSGEYVCTDQSNGCVPVNFFAPSLYENLVGDFATRAERDFLFDSRDFETTYEQTIFAGFMGGSVYELPAGAVTAGFGFEYRIDDIASIPDDIARDGLFFGFFADGGAEGDKSTKEYFFEVEIPVLANMTFAKELIVNLSARNTKDEFYGDNTTYSWKVGYRPIDSLLLRATAGTSYRAPNVRENFLRGQTGFNNGLSDPCAVPDEARNALTGGYNAANDEREPQVLANCVANGVDPTTFGNASGLYSVEVLSGGIEGLNEEQSDSETYGFSWAQPFTNAFDLTVGATYYKIEITDTIVEPSSQFIVNDCYGDLEGNSSFCDRITRDPTTFEIDIIDGSFLNRDAQTVRGVDVNINVGLDSTILGSPVRYTADLVATHTKEASQLFTGDNGGVNFEDDDGDFGYPDWRGNLQLAATMGNYRFTWSTRYIGSVTQDIEGVDEFDNGIIGIADTCDGLNGVLCRDVGYAGVYINHSSSVYYRGDTWTIGAGVRNIFSEAPPQVDGNEVFARNNVPFGNGYDIMGRTFFVNVGTKF
jgi:iron complex outermembrane receptor protein